MSQETQSETLVSRMQVALQALGQRWSAMQPAQRRLLVLCVVAFAGLASVSTWWSSRTDWRTLFSGMEGRDAAQVQQQLSSAGIAYQTTPDGTAVQVPAEQLDKARVAIAAKGMPQSGRLGFELFDKPNWVGSEFDEQVNYQRALEGELEHTIETMDAIRSARVHVVLAKQGAFSSEDKPAKASVVLKLRRSSVPRDEAESVRNMIAGAVEGLQASAVTLVDADGRVDLSPQSAHGSTREDETALEQKLIAVLEPLAGIGNVHATVNVSYAQHSEEHTDEVYDPSQAVPVSTQKTEQTAQATRAGGIPGTASNTPAAVPVSNTPNGAGSAAGTSAALPGPAGQAQLSREEASSYAVTRHVTHTEEGPGRVRRIAAAIVINDRPMLEKAGKQQHTAWKPRSADEMHRMEQLAQAAVGFEAKRGDEVVLENIGFSGNGEEATPALIDRIGSQTRDLLRSQPSLLRTVATGIALLLLGVMVLRPLTKQAASLLAVSPKQLAETGEVPLQLEAIAPTESEGSLMQNDMGAARQAQNIFDRVSAQIKAETQGSTRLVEAWIAGTEEAD